MRKQVLCLITSLLLFAGTFFNSACAVSANASEINTAGSDEIDNEEKDEDNIYNSVALLNYFAVLSQEVVSSKNSRIQLERISDEVFNNIKYNVIDEDTQAYIKDLQENIESLRMADKKRERVQYLFEQEQAANIKSAVPNPISLFSGISSKSLVQLVSSIVYMSIDSYTGYKNAQTESEMKKLQQDWELDDEQDSALEDQRQATFDYSVNIVRKTKYEKSTLTPNTVKDFVDIKNNKNVKSRLTSLRSETNQNQYKSYGGYWLLLADTYYQDKAYEKCLDSIKEYEKLNINIFRTDTEYAQEIPVAVAACQELHNSGKMSDVVYMRNLARFAKKLQENTKDSDWKLRYEEAQIYIEIYNLTESSGYLKKAYEVLKNNVNNLKDEQIKLNEQYLKDVDLMEVPKKAAFNASNNVKKKNKKQRQEAEAFNEAVEQTRKTELAPIYEPLKLNLDLLFEVADKIDISTEEAEAMDAILHEKQLFINPNVDMKYWMTNAEMKNAEHQKVSLQKDIPITFDKKEITIPADYMASDASIEVIIDTSKKGEQVFKDWKCAEVTRGEKDKNDVSYPDSSSFVAHYTSEEYKKEKVDFSDGDTVTIKITPGGDEDCVMYSARFEIHAHKVIFDKMPLGVSFERTQ